MSFTIAAGDAAPGLLKCPKCKETIDSAADTCSFCGATVDHEAAQQAAATLAKVKQAVSDARYMRACALALPVFIVLRYIPSLPWVGGIGYLGLSLLVPIWALLWWMKYARLNTVDDEYRVARMTVKVCGIVVGLVLAFLIVLPFLIGLILFLTGIAHPTSPAQ